MTIVAFVLVAGSLLSSSMKNGLNSTKQRLGADLMVVPVGYDEGVEGILLKGEPSYFYLDSSIAEEIGNVEGVQTYTTQFFLTSLNQDCCDIPVQFIGYDPDTDFLIKPWISEVYSDDLKDGELIIGSDIVADDNQQLKFFNEKYHVAARLAETGTGLDQAVYGNMNTLMHLFQAAKKAGLAFIDNIDPQQSVSCILIRIRDGYSAEEVTHNIRASVNGVQVIKTKNMITTTAENLGGFISFIYVFAALFVLVAIFMLSIVFSVMANERKREFAILRALGASGKKISKIVLTETLILSGAGAALGTILAGGIILSFNTYIGDRLGLPYLQPAPWIIAIFMGGGFLITVAIGPIAMIHTIARLNKREVYITLREGE